MPWMSATSSCGSTPSKSSDSTGLRSQRASASSEWHHSEALAVGVPMKTRASLLSRLVKSWSRQAAPGTSPSVGETSRKTES